MLGHGGDSLDSQFHIADRAHVQGDAFAGEVTDQLRIFHRPHSVLDASDAEVVEDPAYEGGRHELAGVGLGHLAGRLRAPPNVDAPGFHPPVFGSVQINAGQIVPAERRLDERTMGGVVVVAHAGENPQLQSGRCGFADRGQHLRAGVFHRGQPGQVDAGFHVPRALFGTRGQNDLGRIMITLGRLVEVHAVLIVQGHELVEALVSEIRLPERRRIRVAFRLQIPKQFDGGGTFEMQMGFGLGQRPDEAGEIGGGSVMRNAHGVRKVGRMAHG